MSAFTKFWKVWLNLNLLTQDVENDYTAEVSTVGKTSRNEDIAKRIVEEGSEIKYDTLLSIINQHDRIIREMEGTTPYLAASKLCPLLEANTQQIMDYYDSTLENAIDHDNYLEFQQALSDLGEALEERFTLEDKLIALVLDNNLNISTSDNVARPA